MKLGPQNSSRNSAAEPPQTDPVILANSDESGKRGKKDNVTHKRKRALRQEVKEAKRMKEVKEELNSIGDELKQFNAALIPYILSKMIEIRMGHRLLLQMMARQDELMVDILDAIEEDDSVKVDDLAQILFST
ncbi:hypothetical protein SLEP1_g34167 [Rubroshorea leprosula]|uniref:Uncharacterized protein n=1 Tax=Rubroshorea leprosula TaxID=152421 RepID=A0AAV5KIX8_9ROSI|nr:hypothetical protein SLEP1_g34167 [Rubroshorea leprosula]